MIELLGALLLIGLGMAVTLVAPQLLSPPAAQPRLWLTTRFCILLVLPWFLLLKVLFFWDHSLGLEWADFPRILWYNVLLGRNV